MGEAITNIAASAIANLSDIKLSANWMAPAGHPGVDAVLYEAVKAVGMELCPALGISIPVGKDSMSMKTVWNDSMDGGGRATQEQLPRTQRNAKKALSLVQHLFLCALCGCFILADITMLSATFEPRNLF